jgi:RNA 3'-terminal phosphate cyclase
MAYEIRAAGPRDYHRIIGVVEGWIGRSVIRNLPRFFGPSLVDELRRRGSAPSGGLRGRVRVTEPTERLPHPLRRSTVQRPSGGPRAGAV